MNQPMNGTSFQKMDLLASSPPSRSKKKRVSSQLLTPPKSSKKPKGSSRKARQPTLEPPCVKKGSMPSTKRNPVPSQKVRNDANRSEENSVQPSTKTMERLQAFRYPKSIGIDHGKSSDFSQPRLLTGDLFVSDGIESQHDPLTTHEEHSTGQTLLEGHGKRADQIPCAPRAISHSRSPIPFTHWQAGTVDSGNSMDQQSFGAQSCKGLLSVDEGVIDTLLDEEMCEQFLNSDMLEEDLGSPHNPTVPRSKEASTNRSESGVTQLVTRPLNDDIDTGDSVVFDPTAQNLHADFVLSEQDFADMSEEDVSLSRSFEPSYRSQVRHQNPPSNTAHSIHEDGRTSHLHVPTTIEAFQSFHSRPFPSSKAFTTPPETTSINDIEALDFDLEHEDFLDENGDEIADLLKLTDQVSVSHDSTAPGSAGRSTIPKLQWNAPREYNSKAKKLSSPPVVEKPSEIVTPSRQSFSIDTQVGSRLEYTQNAAPTYEHLTINGQPNAESDILNYEDPPPADHHIAFSSYATTGPQPFVRSRFPPPLRDRSSIPGLSPTSRLRTCFRIGEALNTASQASRSHIPAIVELYAFVLHSERKMGTQTFKFADLFRPDRPPFLDGSWNGWKGSEYWELDARAFLKEKDGGRMCRVVAKMERQAQGKWGLVILSLWEADWEDVDAVKGVFCA